MAIRVALVGTGNCGRIALIQLIEDPRFELTAVGVSTEAKVGKDAGELAGVDTITGVKATLGMDEVLASKPDCLVYTAMGDTRPIEARNASCPPGASSVTPDGMPSSRIAAKL